MIDLFIIGLPAQVIDKAAVMWSNLQKTQKPISPHFIENDFDENKA